MSRKEQRKLEKSSQKQETAETPKKVFMRFTENKFYNDQENPIFEKGKIYPLEGGGWIQRWLKRGGEIVSEEEAKKSEPVSKVPEVKSDGGVVKIVSGPEVPKTEEKIEEKKQDSVEGEIRNIESGNDENTEE